MAYTESDTDANGATGAGPNEPSPASKGAAKVPKERETWLGRLRREEAAHKPYRDQARRAMREYQCLPREGSNLPVLYPIYWANTKITQAAIFNNLPIPVVRRRYGDTSAPAAPAAPEAPQGGPQAAQAPQQAPAAPKGNPESQMALAIERALKYALDTGPYSQHWNRAVTEFLVAALGVDVLYLDTKTTQVQVTSPEDGAALFEMDEETGEKILGKDGQPIPVMREIIVSQRVCPEYIPASCFAWEPGKDWEDTNWVAITRYMSGSKIKAEFGVDVADSKTSDSIASDATQGKLRAQAYTQQYPVKQIFDRKKRREIWLCADLPALWRVDGDRLQLEDFYPFAEPMFLDLLSGETIPQPEFSRIESLCDEINRLTARIKDITGEIKARGYYDASWVDELGKLVQSQDNAFVPIASLMARLKETGMAGPVLWEVNDDRVKTVVALSQQREQAKAELYEITGISDIVRGASDASETASAQQLKGQWANVRLSEKQKAVQAHYRATFRLMAEIIAEHFDPAQLSAQTGVTLDPQQIETLRNDLARCYAIDVETDSTIAQDEAQEKSDRTEAYTAITGAMSQLLPLEQQGVVPADMVNGLIRFLAGAFPRARELEELVQGLPDGKAQLQRLTQQAQQQQQQLEQLQAQNEELQKQVQAADQAKVAVDQQRAQADQMRAQTEAQRAAAETQTDAARAQAQNQLDGARTAQIVNGIVNPPPPPLGRQTLTLRGRTPPQ